MGKAVINIRTKRVEFDLNPKGVDSYTKEVIREAIRHYSKNIDQKT